MKISEIPFNMNLTVDELYFSEKADDVNELKQGVSFLIEKLNETKNPEDRASISFMIGVFAKFNNDYDLSLTHLEKSLDYASAMKVIKLELLTLFRIGLTHYYSKKYSHADIFFNKSLNLIKKHRELDDTNNKDKVIINYGRSKFKQKQYKAALNFFINSMDLRVKNGQISEITEIEKLIEMTRERIK